MPPQKINFFRGEVHVLEEVQRLLESCRNQIISVRGKMTDE